jgi:Flp pilus assembly protein protease CpaA
MLPAWTWLALKGAITLWLIVVSVWDRVERRVPNVLVLPVMCGALLWQAYVSIAGTYGTGSPPIAFVLVAWVVLFLLWRAHIFGGGDAKLLMALFALFPTTQFLLLFAVVVLAVTLPLVALKAARTGLGRSWRNARERLASGQALPTAEDLRTQGRPHCWSLALPGVIYLWLVL